MMTTREVLAAEIPKGDYKLAMEKCREKPLDFKEWWAWAMAQKEHPQFEAIEDILRAATGLTLGEALARLRGGAPCPSCVHVDTQDYLCGECGLYPKYQSNIPSAETGQNVGGFDVQSVTSEPVVRLSDVDDVLDTHYADLVEGRCSRRWLVYQELAKRVLPASPPPGMVSVEAAVKSIKSWVKVCQKNGVHDPEFYLPDAADDLIEDIRSLADPAQKEEAKGLCLGCGCTKAKCDAYRETHKVCCPDCDHAQKEEGNG